MREILITLCLSCILCSLSLAQNCGIVTGFSHTTTGTGPYTHNISITVSTSNQGGGTKNVFVNVKCGSVALSGFPTCLESNVMPYTYQFTNSSCAGPITLEWVGYTGNACFSGNQCNNCTPVSGGTASGPASVCTGFNATLTLTGSAGDIQWQKKLSTAPVTAYVNISGATGPTLVDNPGTTGNTYNYRACLTNLCDAPAYSNEVSVLVDAASVGGTVTGGTSPVCLGTSPGQLTLNGYSGSIVWQSSTDSITFTNISPTQSGVTYTPPSSLAAGTWFFRAVTTSGACTANSTVRKIIVDGTSVGGSITGGSTPICLGSSTGTMTLSGYTGTALQWQRRVNSGSWLNVGSANSTTLADTPSSAGTWDYRVVVTNGVCASTTSGTRTIVVDATSVGGNITGGKNPVCQGDNIGTLTLSGYTGTTLQWQRDDGLGFMDISGANGTSFTESLNDIGTYHYRVIVTNGACASSTSSTMTIDVNQASVGGIVTGGTTPIMLGESTGTMTLSSYVGDIVKWQKRLNNNPYTDITNLLTTYSETPSSAGTWYYRAVVKSGDCPEAFSIANPIVVEGPLPIDLVEFNATAINSIVSLKWVTLSEFNNQKFIIERRSEQEDFSGIGEVLGNGTTQARHEYEFTDSRPFSGMNYYRLKQVDFDGKFEYSSIKNVALEHSADILVYPTLTDGELNISLGANANSTSCKVNLFSIQGVLVLSEDIIIENETIISLQLPDIPAGNYLLEVATGKRTAKFRIVKK